MPATATKPATRLDQVKKSVIKSGVRYLFFGPEGVGKSTLASHAPHPIFFDCDDSPWLKIARYPFRDDGGGHVPRTLEEVMGAINDLLVNDHVFESVVIDSMDRLETLVWDFCLRRDSKSPSQLNPKGKTLTSIEGYGYGKGYQVALDEWRRLTARLDELRRQRGMNIVMVGHAAIRRFANPAGEDWDRYQLRLQDADKVSAAGFIKEWADVVGFVCFEEGASKEDDQRKAKGYSTGMRLIKFERTAAHDAKSRIPLPPEVEMSIDDPWAPLAAAVLIGLEMDGAKIAQLIGEEVARIGDEVLADKVAAAVKNAKGNVATLGRYLNDLRRRTVKEN